MTGWTRDTIRDSILETIADHLRVPREELTEGTSLLEELRVDSLLLFEIVVDLEERFGIRISNEEAESLHNIRDAVDFVTRELTGGPDAVRLPR